MQEHAGKIHVESEPGVGTAFQLEFPSSGARPATNQETPKTSVAPDERKAIHA
jgi:two-component system, NtrC family, sensor kinase